MSGQSEKALNVLLVTYSFPPAAGVGVLRAASLARYLPFEGIRLDVLTASNPSAVGSDPALLREISPDVTIHRVLALDLPFKVKKTIKRFISRTKTDSQQAKAASGAGPRGVARRLVENLLLPDPQVTWLPGLKRAARRIIRKRAIDLVLITVPPFSSVLLVKNLRKRFPELSILVDFRDEWLSTAIELFGFSRSERARAIAREAEAGAVSNATAVVAVTESARREIRSRYPNDPESKFQLIPNGFDATRLASPSAQRGPGESDKIVITHVGTVYRTTDPLTFIEALRSLPKEVAARFKIRFIGHIEEQRFRDALLELGEIVELSGFLPQQKALSLLEESDYALLISHDPLNVGAKFYDYVGGGKPILAAVETGGELRRLFEDLRAGWWADVRDAGAIRQLFFDAAARGKPPFAAFRPDTAKIAQYERRILAQRYGALLRSIAEAKNGRGWNSRDVQADRRES